MDTEIHFNCDMGEGLGNEASIMPFIHAANIACGGHAGDEQTIIAVLHLASDHDVAIGIHPSYPDRENFGRKVSSPPPTKLKQAWNNQFDLFLSCCHRENVVVNHIKPHGALYHQLSVDEALALSFLDCCHVYLPGVKMYGFPKSKFLNMAEKAGFIIVREGFADRGYLSNGGLASRDLPGAIIHDEIEMCRQVLDMYKNGSVKTIDDKRIEMPVDTICVHGDHPNTVHNMQYISRQINSK